MDDETVARLLSLTSHELRSPLGVVRGYLKWLEQHGDGLLEQHRQVVAASLRASDRLAEILAELSALAQLLRGDVAMAREPVPLAALAEEVAAAFGAQRRTVTLLPLDIADFVVVGDRPLLQSALVALAAALSQALPGELELGLSGQLEGSGERTVALELSPRQPPDDLVDAPLDLTRGGVGLSLAVAAEIVAAHGGRIVERHAAGRLRGMRVWLPRSVEPKDVSADPT
jgi:signal transduction histidine kinase